MSGDLAAWLASPITLALAGAFLVLVVLLCEILLHTLAELGNVRFQGLIDDHPHLLPAHGEDGLHLSRVLDAARWVQVGATLVLAAILLRFPGLGPVQAIAITLLVPLALVLLARFAIGSVGEEAAVVLLRLLRFLLWPLVALMVRVQPPPPPPQVEPEEEEASDREIQAYLEAGQLAGIFERDEGEFLESLVEFFDTVVREVMTPRTEMVAVADSATFEELLETFARTHKSRVPIFHETVDQVLGVVHVKNLVEHVMRGEAPEVSALVHDCLVVPEAKPLGELLRDFQREHQQLAIVVDEYGGTSGLVTLEDLLEEIVGEIQDEHDPAEPPEVEEIEEGVYRLLGRAPLELLEDLFGIEVDEEDFDTVGGLVFSRHGTVPDEGTTVVDPPHRLRFVVDEMQERRIVAVIVRRVDVTNGSVFDGEAGP